MFSNTGLNCLYARNGNQALQLFHENPTIEVVLMDVQLPDINGLQLTRIMKKENPKLIVIAQTAYASSIDTEKSIDAGCSDYISKPLNSPKLLAIISKYLNK